MRVSLSGAVDVSLPPGGGVHVSTPAYAWKEADSGVGGDGGRGVCSAEYALDGDCEGCGCLLVILVFTLHSVQGVCIVPRARSGQR